MVSVFSVHLSNHSYLIEEQLAKRGLTDAAIISLERFTGADKQPQIRVWYRDGKTTAERDEQY